MFRNLLNTMDVSPSLRLDEHFKASDLFELVSCTDYDLSGTGLGSDWGLDEIVGRTVNNNNVTVGDMTPSWTSGPYADPPTPTPPPPGILHLQEKDKETTDKMWGGGGTTERVVNSATGNTILITFPPTDSAAHTLPDTSDPSHNPSPPMTEHNNLDLFTSILNEKPYEVLVSHNHRSPASDCVSYGSACSGYSDSGISTSLDDTASPNGGGQDHVDFDRLVDSAVDLYSPGAPGMGPVDDGSGLDGNGYLASPPMSTYITPVTQSNDVSSILEGALRGTVRRPGGPSQPSQLNKVTEGKTLTLMTNMTPLPPLTTAFKAEQLNGVAGSTQISSSNGMYITTGYDYHPPPPEEFTSLDASFTKLSTATSTKMTGHSDSTTKPKKRKYTKRQPGEEPTAKGRLLHFCHICNKGFKDKYSVNVHIRTHTGEKPFNCELCGKCFRQKAHLAKHVQIHNTPKPPGKR